MKDDTLRAVLDNHAPHELLLIACDGFRIYNKESNEMLWKWDASHDGEPYGALETLFAMQGLKPEH